MKLKIRIVVAGLVLVVSVIAKTTEKAKPEPILIANEQMLGERLISIQRQYFPVSLPSLTERLLQPAGSFPVDFENFDPENRKLFRGWIDENGIVRHSVGLYEDYWTGEIVVLDDSGWEIFRIGRDSQYDKYALQREFFDLGKKEILKDKFTREIFLPAKISTLVDLVPTVFWDAHIQFEQEAQSFSAPMMMSMESEENEKATATMTVGSNDLITLNISVPEGWRYVEIFKKDDLVYSSGWSVAGEWLPTFGANMSFIDSVSGGKNEGFYLLSNAEIDTDGGDGRSDLYEEIMGGNSESFDSTDSDIDGLLDTWEIKLFGSLDESGSGDFDFDGIPNNVEMVFDSSIPSVTILTDPSLYSSDGDALSDAEQFGSPGVPPSDPWCSDVTKPSATVTWPTNNAVVIF